MNKYTNTSGKSPITGYTYDETSITICFKGTEHYIYPISKIGKVHLVEMISLANSGQGLCSFINKHRDVWLAGERVR